MKRVLETLSWLAAIMVLASCSSGGGGAQQSPFRAAPWQAGDRLIYHVLDKNGNKIGTSGFGFAREGDVWVISFTDKLSNVEQTAMVRLEASSLKPLGEEKSIKAPGVDATVSTTYKDGKLNIDAVQNGKPSSASIDVPGNAIENDQLLMTLRALPFADRYEVKLVTVVGQNAAKVDTTVRVKGKEKVDVPAGTFEAWKVELDFGQGTQQAWYQVDAPHNMLQYDNGTTKMVLTTE
jgi:hypothetical protein